MMFLFRFWEYYCHHKMA